MTRADDPPSQATADAPARPPAPCPRLFVVLLIVFAVWIVLLTVLNSRT